MAEAPATVALTVDEIFELARTCLMANGCDEANAGAVARTLSAAERDGAASHGLFRLPAHIASLRSGTVDGMARPQEDQISAAAIRLDGNRGFAPLAIEHGTRLLADLTAEAGVGVLLLRRSFHLYALWPEVEALAAHDLAGFACTIHTPMMAPFGARSAFFSTNPMSFAWPRPGADPYVFDMATAARARGDVGIAARDGHELEPGVGLDADGNPTTDAKKVHDGGMLLPFGGYKGSVLATMIELLAAGLVGDFFSYEAAAQPDWDGGPVAGGQFIMAWSPEVLAGPGWHDHGETFLDELRALPGVRHPGERRFANRLDTGPRQVNAALVDELRALC